MPGVSPVCFDEAEKTMTKMPEGNLPTLVSPVSSEIVLAAGCIRTSDRDACGVLAFKGIPYAAPPVGALRWRPPESAPAWTGVRDATVFGPRCVAPPLGEGGPVEIAGATSEDCLTLNVWTAALSSDEKRPVMVWVHGGGFQVGGSGEASTDGARFGAKGVVLVSFNYRLGVFGFLSHTELDREGTPSGNFGLQDQIAALKWVRANIAKFGGNPENITIFGESAGSNSVCLLMASPRARGLFHRAIGESGAFWDGQHGSMKTRVEAQELGIAFANRVAHGSIGELRALPAEALNREAGWDFRYDPNLAGFSPSIDGFVVPESPASAFAQGRQADVSLLAGWNGAEGLIFYNMVFPCSPSAAELQALGAVLFGDDHLAEFLRYYPANTDAQATISAQILAGDLLISEQTWEWLQMHRRTGSSPVYAYQYNYGSPYSPIPVHTAEISFVFGTLTPAMLSPAGPPPGPRDRELSEQMMSYWINFARTGNPNDAGLPIWPEYATEDSTVMVFGEATSAAPESDTARFRFIQKFRKHGRMPEAWRRTAF